MTALIRWIANVVAFCSGPVGGAPRDVASAVALAR